MLMKNLTNLFNGIFEIFFVRIEVSSSKVEVWNFNLLVFQQGYESPHDGLKQP